jgi:predicted MPP superfamily phosphohydrolase
MTESQDASSRKQIRFRFLHLSDLHVRDGKSNRSECPLTCREFKDAFFNDLGKLFKECGPWHAILFSGDLVFSGKDKEFENLEKFLKEVDDKLHTLGQKSPFFLAVPGNHDLDWSSGQQNPADVERLVGLWDVENQSSSRDRLNKFFAGELKEIHTLVRNSFANYMKWSKTPNRFPDFCERDSAILPGDFSVRLEVDGCRVGVIGLNTTFVQARGGKCDKTKPTDDKTKPTDDDKYFRGRLVWGERQVAELVRDLDAWAPRHHIRLLMTHQSPRYMYDHETGEVYNKVYPDRTFELHLFGHLHLNRRGNFYHPPHRRRLLQGHALFNAVKIENGPKLDLRVGYSAVEITWAESASSDGLLRIWPRWAKCECDSEGNAEVGTFVCYRAPTWQFVVGTEYSEEELCLGDGDVAVSLKNTGDNQYELGNLEWSNPYDEFEKAD